MTHITDQTAQEVFDSLKGFDEIAIAKSFGRDVVSLSNESRPMFGRSLCFTVFRRDGLKDTEAYDRAMDMTMGEVTGAFPDDAEDLDEDAEGKTP